MKFISRINKETISTKNTKRKYILQAVLSPVYLKFMLSSNTLQDIVNKYKDVPLTPYIMTEHDKVMIEKDPEYLLDLPRYVVEGYDHEVCKEDFDSRVRDEFIDRCYEEDQTLVSFINTYNKLYKAVCEERRII